MIMCVYESVFDTCISCARGLKDRKLTHTAETLKYNIIQCSLLLGVEENT